MKTYAFGQTTCPLCGSGDNTLKRVTYGGGYDDYYGQQDDEDRLQRTCQTCGHQWETVSAS